MVIETYKRGPVPVYERAARNGRMLPDGLAYVDSWVDADSSTTCFQLMRTDDPTLFDTWIGTWADLVDCEVTPVVTSAEASRTHQ
jgi:hypothetical protein